MNFGKKILTFLGMTLLFSQLAVATPFPEPDHTSIPEWIMIKKLMFGEREIKDGSVDDHQYKQFFYLFSLPRLKPR